MKKKLSIFIAIVVMAAFVFSTVSMAALDSNLYEDIASTQAVFSLDGKTLDEVKAVYQAGVGATELVADSESGQLAHFPVGDGSHFAYLPVTDASAFDGIALRVKLTSDTPLDNVVISISDENNLQPLANDFIFVDLDGTVTEDLDRYAHTAPANFDGYILISFDDFTPQGGGSTTKEGSEITKGDGTVVLDLTKLKAFNITIAAECYIGDTLLYTLSDGTDGPGNTDGSGNTDAPGNTSSPVNTDGPGNVGNTGAPLMIGTALAALVSCAFVFKASKKQD